MKWRAPAASSLQYRSWDDEFIVYNSLSGDTHLLNADAGQILLAVCGTPMDIPTLAALLAQSCQVEPEEEFHLQIERMLVELQALSLIETC